MHICIHHTDTHTHTNWNSSINFSTPAPSISNSLPTNIRLWDGVSTFETISCQATAAQPALVAGWSENHLQDGGGHIQSPTPAYLSRHLQPHNCVQNLRSSDIPLLRQPFSKTDFARCGFRYSAPAVWNSLPRTVLKLYSTCMAQW